tara:strand:- start:140 stop:1120 length:981 start_codon:yes stop_codon:yes gene_type:complete
MSLYELIMGIQYLNKYLTANCCNGIQRITLEDLRNKKIAIDISIYMYDYKSRGDLIEFIYKMVLEFISRDITPVFVFDGKPPPEKKLLLAKRRREKNEAYNEIETINKRIETTAPDSSDYAELSNKLVNLKKRTTKITSEDISEVKTLFRLCGVTYYDACGEADALCAKLVSKNLVWACMSDDMDMFLYGCNRVLRHYSLFNNTLVLYETKKILDSLKVSMCNFREICVVSGTDYNYNESRKANIYKSFAYYKQFVNERREENFYEWLNKNTNYIDDYCSLCVSYLMFDIGGLDIDKYNNMPIRNGPINKEQLIRFLEKYNFIYIK